MDTPIERKTLCPLALQRCLALLHVLSASICSPVHAASYSLNTFYLAPTMPCQHYPTPRPCRMRGICDDNCIRLIAQNPRECGHNFDNTPPYPRSLCLAKSPCQQLCAIRRRKIPLQRAHRQRTKAKPGNYQTALSKLTNFHLFCFMR